MLRTPLIYSAVIVAFLGCGKGANRSSDASPVPEAPEVIGSCHFQAEIMADPAKIGADEAAKAPTSFGEMCDSNRTQSQCDPKNKGIATSLAWMASPCSGGYIAKCPYGSWDRYLYMGSSTPTVKGGLEAQKTAFAFACKADGSTPEVK